jgi:hypothetical protein
LSPYLLKLSGQVNGRRAPSSCSRLRLASLAVARVKVLEGSSDSSQAAGDTAAATRAAATKEVVDEAAAKEVAEEAAEKKKAIEAAARKKAAEEAAAKKKVVEEEATKKKASEEATKKTKSGAATAGSGPSPTPSAGVKRAAAPSGSTPLAKWRFLGS